MFVSIGLPLLFGSKTLAISLDCDHWALFSMQKKERDRDQLVKTD